MCNEIIWIDSINLSDFGYWKKFIKDYNVIIIKKNIKENIKKLNRTDYLLVSGSRIKIGEEILNVIKPEFIQKTGVGYEIFDLKTLTKNEISLCNTKGINSQAVAEHTIWLILSVLRKSNYAEFSLRNGDWSNYKKNNLRKDSCELKNKVVGLIGLGDIGRKVAALIKSFNCKKILYYKRTKLANHLEKKLNVQYCDLEKLLNKSDVISLHLPLSKNTKNLIGKKEFNLMKTTSILINTSRGGVVDEKALIEALKKNRIKGAGLDVLITEPPLKSNPLLNMNNTSITPHIGGTTKNSYKEVLRIAFLNIKSVIKGERPREKDVILDFFK